MKISISKIKKKIIFPEMELSSSRLTNFLYFRNGTFLYFRKKLYKLEKQKEPTFSVQDRKNKNNPLREYGTF